MRGELGSLVDHAEEKLRDAVDAADDPKTDAGVRAARIQLIRAKTAQQKVEKHTDGVEKRRVAKKSNKYLLLFLVVAGFSAVLYFGLLEGEFTILELWGLLFSFLSSTFGIQGMNSVPMRLSILLANAKTGWRLI